MKIAVGIVLAALLGRAPGAQDMSGHGMQGMQMGEMHQAQPASAGMLRETGQSAFAAIAEATAALEADPATDWSKANLDALRDHLVDMDNVTLHSDVARHDVPMGARFDITSTDPRVRASIDRMVRLHASMANSEGPYRLIAEAISNGTALTVVGSSPTDEAKIHGLGFFGLLTEGVHHQRHHLMLARGEPMQH